ncbi:MAG TPA: ATP-binding protein, partial [Longimicrobium sp.]|nr:ATP-binding protein [Longimicrobium sp.]
DAQIDEAAAEMARLEAMDPPPALPLLAQRFGLSPFEREVLLLAVAMELDTRFPALCARAQDDASRPWPTFALALTLFDDAAWEALSPEGPLRYWRLLEVAHAPPQPLTTSPLRADERIVNYAKGLNHLDDRLSGTTTPLRPPAGVGLSPSQEEAAEAAWAALQAAGPGPVPIVHLLGGDGESKQLVAAHVCDRLGLRPHRLLPGALGPAADVESLARLWRREAALLPLALYLEQPDGEGEQPDGALARFAARAGSFCFLDARDLRLPSGTPSIPVEVDKPTAAEQREAWGEVLGPMMDGLPAALAGQFDLGLPALHRVAREGLAAADEGAPLRESLWDAALKATRPGMDRLAVRVDARATWDDLVLPPTETALLRQVAAQVAQRSRVYEEWGFGARMNRGMGIAALFAGESGTGKTMAAEVIAKALRLNLYRIDLSAVVSKYIGETEKNLRRLFDAAEDGGAILFFDEADAIFGKRSEVKDSHDRYANIEINYLLQRMEAYRGLAILATNVKSALDTAFLRRLRFVVEFPFPAPAERRRMWERAFPPQAEVEGLDADRLSRLPMAGGSIHNVALNAAFQAAHEGTPVTMPIILNAARAEFRKLERPVSEAEFRWTEPALGAA